MKYKELKMEEFRYGGKYPRMKPSKNKPSKKDEELSIGSSEKDKKLSVGSSEKDEELSVGSSEEGECPDVYNEFLDVDIGVEFGVKLSVDNKYPDNVDYKQLRLSDIDDEWPGVDDVEPGVDDVEPDVYDKWSDVNDEGSDIDNCSAEFYSYI
jgi:hypothetical protein